MAEKTRSWEEWETIHSQDLIGVPREQVEMRTVDGRVYVMVDPLSNHALRDLLQAAYEHVDIHDRPFPGRQELSDD